MLEKTERKEALASSRLRVGAAIRARWLAAALSLAERIGVALSTMSKIENGKSRPASNGSTALVTPGRPKSPSSSEWLHDGGAGPAILRLRHAANLPSVAAQAA
jgi:hypothetical protein